MAWGGITAGTILCAAILLPIFLWQLILRRHLTADLTSDLQAGTLRVPLYSPRTSGIPALPVTYRTVPLAEAQSFRIALYRDVRSDSLKLLQLRLRLTSGEEIPVEIFPDRMSLPPVDARIVVILALWLNDQLGLRQPAELLIAAGRVVQSESGDAPDRHAENDRSVIPGTTPTYSSGARA
jgi:hypothetical protein